ncbi:MAG: hypothetical protein JWM74_2970 [Myxococcaceae bacterium]|jgi:steroid delta-isomerase-like uncharacterized protein|nr:hypothetical protein [Myxococcaceae bacterium]
MSETKLEANKNVVRLLFEDVFNAGNVEAAAGLVHFDYVQHSPLAAPGLAGLQAFVVEVRGAFADLHFTIEDLVAEGDRVVARVIATGTHRAAFLGIGATARAVRAQSIDIFRLRDGKLAEHWDVLDVYAILLQLGATVTPPPATR